MAIQSVHDLNNLLKRTNEYLNAVPNRIQKLKDEVQRYNDEVLDIQHYIELSGRKNASAGYKLYAELQEVLQKRREVKDELDYLETIEKRMKNTFKHNNGLYQIVEGIQHKSEVMQTRSYNPRIRTDLFNK
ncbi:hypothetical protein D7X33_21735 [Butyricicoccus sp. 1XD8-22]|nr:hypothetical protein D7X33_21735 [Butyricicoccus sp. 1XD8-22]